MKTKYLEIKKSCYEGFRFVIASGDGEEHKKCKLQVAGFGYWCSLKLPSIIKPKATKVYPTIPWDTETIKRLGRDYYYHYDERQYGVSIYEGHVSFYYGIQTFSSDTTKQWGFFLPWTQSTFVRRTFYNLDGSVYANFSALTYKQKEALGRPGWDQEYEASKKVEKVHFSFLDYDFKEIIASCYIEEREWHRGTSWCSWMKYFTKPMIRRSLDLAFSEEVGPKKGSWKGGTLGHGTDIEVGEEPIDAFLRYCDKEKLRFVDIAEAPPQKEYVKPEPKEQGKANITLQT
jgi:hypothetical protein